jgi:prepilin-type N-terminal cleavage/methylation domain-containing protein
MTLLTRRAFSLIEVLIAILVLGLGLLGLGAVFPAVISEQRRAFDSISGESLAMAVQDQMQSNTEAFDFGLDQSIAAVPTTPEAAVEKFGIWARDPQWDFWLFGVGDPRPQGPDESARPTSPTNPAFLTEWMVSGAAALGRQGGVRTTYIRPGYLAGGRWTLNRLSNNSRFELPVSARVFPAPSSGVTPRLVWDPVFRRTANDEVQVAIFVRRIDDRIRLNPGESLGDAILGLNRPRALLPLALSTAEADGGRLTTDDGSLDRAVAYPEILSLPAYVDRATDPSWLMLDVTLDEINQDSDINTSIEFLRRPGQIIVDSLGVVRRVVGTPTAARGQSTANAQRAIIVDPPFSRSVNLPRQNLQIVFTPQPPVAVRVFTLDKE